MASARPSIFVDDPATWPSELAVMLQDALPLLRDYHAVEAERDRIWETRHQNPEVRHNLPPNTFREGKEAFLGEVSAYLARTEPDIMAGHCTRLCDDEIAAILSSGLFPLSPETFAVRVRRRLEVGDMTAETAARLTAENQVNDPGRQNAFCFVNTRGELATTHVTDLFTWWGGEALYNSHDSDPVTGPILASLGRPCIVEACLPWSSTAFRPEVEETLIRVFQLRHGINDGEHPECGGHTRRPVGPERSAALLRPNIQISPP